MTKNIVVVESPAKAKTIRKYLGKDFSVLASYGHVRDLLPKTGSVDPDHDFSMTYESIEKNIKHVEVIRKAVKGAEALYLAPDPDREGEAIAWHIYQMLLEKGALKNKIIHRVSFNQITQSAIKDAFKNPQQIDMDLVNAQQARRALDYLVGFNLSPLLWKKVQRGLSAGRVQSPALRLIVEREEEIEQFKPQEYWTLTAECEKRITGTNRDLPQPNLGFKAKLVEYLGRPVKQFTITQEKQAQEMKQNLLDSAQSKLTVTKIEKKQRKRNALPPFITSTLQQEAANKLGFTTKRTMQIAQQLYEGVDIGEGPIGLITYMRTDSFHLAPEAIDEIREVIGKQYGKENVPPQPNFYKTKSRNAQEAHEAIRPTSSARTPSSLKNSLTAEQFKLYQLIWNRAVASQMIHATINTVSVDLSCSKGIFRATGSTIVQPGFLLVYEESKKETDKNQSAESILPPLQEKEIVNLKKILDEQHFTEPPPRYSEASLVKTLEELGIGRPSTYAAIISTLQQRKYVKLENKRFHPTDIGRIVNKFLTQYFPKYVDYDFTAQLENELDEVSRGEKVWIKLLKLFWVPFKKQINDIDQSVKRSDVTQEALDKVCPKCGKKLSIRLGRGGRFIGCTGYPECKYTENLSDTSQKVEPEIVEGRVCPTCQNKLVIKQGRYGKFIGCSNYPQCKYIESLNKPEDTKVTCPECFKGTLLKRKSKRGKIFYSCSRYPECQYSVWNEPMAERCPKCGWPILTLKTTKKNGTQKTCPQKNCDYIE